MYISTQQSEYSRMRTDETSLSSCGSYRYCMAGVSDNRCNTEEVLRRNLMNDITGNVGMFKDASHCKSSLCLMIS